jgi:hypothetical protein
MVAISDSGQDIVDSVIPPREAPQAAPPEPPVEPLSEAQRRKMVLEQLAEARKRRRVEAETIEKAWGGVVAAVGVQEVLDIAVDDAQWPEGVHATHCIVQCGGYLGCARCGRVVGWQGRDRLREACRVFCPRGSQRAIRRLVKGLHPYERETHGSGAPLPTWPSGEAAPTPRRIRSGVG